MQFGILGSLAVWVDGRELPLGGAKQRGLLAVLLLRANELVPTARLVEELWDEEPPATPLKAVQGYVSRLRKVLGDGVLETRPGGYVLRLDAGALDVQRFEGLLEQGRRLLADGAAEEAARVLREALALWRGPALADFQFESFARNEIGRLEELRLVALEQRLEADLALGRHAEVVGELEGLVREHPLRERLRELLILALYRSGRQADALAAYQDARAALVDELGLDPSQALQRLERSILRQDPSLELAAAKGPPVGPPSTVLSSPSAPPHLCAACGAGNAAAARFCHVCGASLAAALLPEARKTVSVLFCDVVAYSELAERLDPESLRQLMSGFFTQATAVLERHGGTVEKFIGDEVMAVFGVPAVREDDALRAVRAALELRESVAVLEPELPKGVRFEVRIGIETGEVVAGDHTSGHGFVAGDAVVVGKRLQQAAEPGDILLGEGTMRFVRREVSAESRSLAARIGKRERVPAWRLVSIVAEIPERHVGSPLVGREAELQALRDAWDDVRRGQRCELVTVLGDAGVGKSRLVTEFVDQVDGLVGRGRCPSYGAGITYLPAVEVLTRLRPHAVELDPAVAAPLRALAGDKDEASTDELAWAFRKLLEAVARTRPLVVVFDDVQWGEEALLDLIEHVAYVSSGAPILLICMARPDLLDRRPAWGGLLRLDPLLAEHAEQLIEARLGGQEPEASVRRRLVAAAGGNPLFIEELAARLKESPDAELTMPPTIQALLAARIDQLDAAERAVVEAAAVEGEVFHLGGVQALAPGELRLTALLTALVRKELIRPERPEIEGEDAFRFRHLLLRDAAYEAMPKATRSELHERYAYWLEQRATDAEALVGYHLEQATRYRLDLGALDDDATATARRAGALLGSAGRQAFTRGDISAAANLLSRAESLLPEDDDLRVSFLPDLGAALREAGELGRAEELLQDAVEGAKRTANRPAELAATVELAALHVLRDPRTSESDRLIARVEHEAPLLESGGDDRLLARAWTLIGIASGLWKGRHARGQEALERALHHARAAGDRRQEGVIVGRLAYVLAWGPMPVSAAIGRCTEMLELAAGHRVMEAEVLRYLGMLHAREGRFDEGRELVTRARASYEELGMWVIAHAARAFASGDIELLAGDYDAAERELQMAYRALDAMGARAYLSSVDAFLAKALYGQGRLDEALETARAAEAGAPTHDFWSQLIARGPHAKVLARRGACEEAEVVAREAVDIVSATDAPELHGVALLDLAEVLQISGTVDAASEARDQALDLFECKGATALALSTRKLLDGASAVRHS